MPEKMTEEEARISRAIRLVRKAKETIKLVGSSTEIPYESDGEEVKVKRPKAEKYDDNQKKEGYGMGGETIGKAEDISHIKEEERYQPSNRMFAGVFVGTIDNIVDDLTTGILDLVRNSNDVDTDSIEGILDETAKRFRAIQKELPKYEFNPQ